MKNIKDITPGKADKYDIVYNTHLSQMMSGRFSVNQMREIAKAYRGSALQFYRDAIRSAIKTFELQSIQKGVANESK